MIRVVLQDGIKDCGVCCLLSIIRYYGGDVSKEYLRQLTSTTKNGVSAYQLVEGAKKVGFSSMGMKGDFLQIEDSSLPCIAHLVIHQKYRHFVVIYRIDKTSEKIFCMDPARGKRVLSFAEFRLLSTQNYIFLKPKQKLPIYLSKNMVRNIIFHLFGKQKLFVILIFLLTIMYFILHILLAFHFKYLLEFSIQYCVSVNLFIISFYLFGLYLFKLFTCFFRNVLLTKWLFLLDKEIIFHTYQQILLLPYFYYKNRTTGEVVSRFRDLGVVKNFLAELFCSVTMDTISILIFVFLMLRIHAKLTYVVMVLFFLLFLISFLARGKKKQLLTVMGKQQDRVNSYLVESLSNVDTIKGSHVEKRLLDQFMVKYHALLDFSYQYCFFTEIFLFLRQAIHDFLLVFLYGFGGYFVIHGQISLGELLVYQTFFTYFLQSGDKLLSLVDEYHNFLVSLERIEDLFTIATENFLGSSYYLPYDLRGDIVFSNLTYRLGSQLLFHELNLMIPFGQKVLLTGVSGSGKSSLVKLLLRYLSIDYGVISIGGIDINHYHLENLRNYITYVSSFEFLFTDTLYHNITLHKDIKQENFDRAVHITMVDEMIQNDSLGYQRMVEENGFCFSNGERQRIILTRALLRESNIYIFDEALSQIDVQKEKIILERIFDFLIDKTVIVISHRFYNQNLFHRILKLENGSIHEVQKL